MPGSEFLRRELEFTEELEVHLFPFIGWNQDGLRTFIGTHQYA
jgi:hypothetical protein